MNIKTFIEQSEREFQEKFSGWILQDDQENYRSFDMVKSFTSQKLRELIGEVRKIVAHEWESIQPQDETRESFSLFANLIQLLDDTK